MTRNQWSHGNSQQIIYGAIQVFTILHTMICLSTNNLQANFCTVNICLFHHYKRTKYPLALVQTFDAPVRQTKKDRDVGLFRLRAQQRDKSEIFPISSIIRGALLVQDYDIRNEYLIMDIVDSDYFLWGKNLGI